MKNGLLLLISFLFINTLNSQNLLTNGDFELGSSGTGFTTNGAGYNELTIPFTGVSVPGNFAVTNFPKSVNSANFYFVGDKTTSSGKMLIIDGKNAAPANARFWLAGNTGTGVSGLTIGKTYTFSYWIRSVSNLVTNVATQADISIQVTGGSLVALLAGNSLAPLPAVGWKHVVYSFIATATTVQIEMWNTKLSTNGNDFAIDDIVLTSDLLATANVSNAACTAANDGSMTVSGILGVPPYLTYTISGPVNQSNATGVFNNLAPGIYTVTVTDSGLPIATTATLNNVIVGPILTVSIDSAICNGNSTTLEVGGSTTGYTWSPATGLNQTTGNLVIASPAVTTIYTVSSTIGACAPSSKSVTVTVNPLPTALISGIASFCPGGNTVLNSNASAGSGSITNYQWKVGGVNVASGGNNATYTSTTAGNYTVEIINSNGCSFTSPSFTVTINALPTASISGTSVICTGINTLLSSNATAGSGSITNYQWKIGGVNVVSNGNNATYNAAIGGNYTVEITNSNGCIFTSASFVVIENAVPTALISGNATICINGSILLNSNATSGSGNITNYQWMIGGVNVTSNGSNATYTVTTGGNYTVKITNSNGCEYTSEPFVVLNSAFPAASISGNSVICSGGNTLLNSNATAGSDDITNYQWMIGGVNVASGGNNATHITNTGGNFTVEITNTNGCKFTSPPFVVTISAALAPTVMAPANQTICPGNSALITLTGTPSSTVTITNSFGNTYGVNILANGNGTFTTPILQSTQTYTVVKIKNFFTQCEYYYTGMTFTVTVVPNGCATVATIPAPGTLPLDLTLCSVGECRTLQANISDVPSTTSYSVTSIPYCPYPFNGAGYNVVPITAGDDFWSPVVNLPFNFCFYGQNYNSCNIGTNGLLTFRPVTGFCDWPDNNVQVANITNQSQSIFGVFQDTDMSVPPTAPDGSVNFKLEGTYPCRKLIVNFYNLGQWNSTGSNPGLQTSQIVLYEVSNIIEVFVKRRVAGTPWAGSGLIGLLGSSGAQSIAPPGRDTGAWTANLEAWRFTPTGPNVSVIIKWFEGATQVGTGPTVTVCPTATTTYTLNAEYNVCGVTQIATSDVTLTVNPDLTSAPIAISQCIPNNTFNLTQNNSNILGSLDPNDYEITYHLTQAEANVLSNPIPNPTVYPIVGTTQTIYAAIFLNAFGCIVVKPFQITLVNCNPTLTIPPDLTLCENTIGSGIATFDFTPQVPIILNGNSASDYTVSFHTTQNGATNNTGIISPFNAVSGTDGQQIFIRYLDNATNIAATGFFTLHVNPKPTATISGATTICAGQTTTISFTGTPNAVINFSGGTVTLNAAGVATFITPALTASINYALIDVTNPVTGCSSLFTDSVTVIVNDLPTATISGTVTVCQNSASPSITFTGASSTSPYTFTYLDPSGTSQTIITTAGSSIGLPVSTANAGTFTYTLVSVSNSTTPVCSQNQTGTATITVNLLPTASISGTVSICSGDTAVI
ncbi:beta strand repeat-containing protein, partial [Flavobacterium sp.]